jgi:hypothetical protein
VFRRRNGYEALDRNDRSLGTFTAFEAAVSALAEADKEAAA